MALESGSRLGPYEVVGRLGSGGMGEVYRARDTRLAREVAIKVLPEEIADPSHLRRLEQEARAASALSHPNVVAVYDVGTHQGAPYVVSELLEGQTLRDRLAGGALPVSKALEHALDIARGLAAAHDKGIVHRDLKPANVFITRDGRVKILDFGLAKLTGPEPPRADLEPDSTGTASGVVLGTVGYMSPEQVRGEEVDPRSDIFSFGAVLFEMLSGTRAFGRQSAAETMTAILREDPAELSGTGGSISPGVARIVRRCLEKRAQDRFHSTHDLALALEAAISGLSSPSPGADGGAEAALAVGSAHRNTRRFLLALVATVMVAGGLSWGLLRPPAPPVGDVIDSIAVLPFENVGGDPDSEYLSDGVAETLLNRLSGLPGLKVIARSTSFRFRGGVDPRQVGRDLKVGAVVTGRVSLRGDTLVIGAELIDVAQGTQLWGKRYNTRMGDVFAAEEEIAGDISRGLRLKLLPRGETLLAKRHTENAEAYRFYLLSRHEFYKSTPEGTRKALEYARRATEEDPSYAPAYAALAMLFVRRHGDGSIPLEEANSRAKAAATQAVEIDETLAEGHTALAQVELRLDWDWAGAEREFKRAIELDPNSPDAHAGYGSYLLAVGRRSEQGIEHAKRAVALDPLSPQWRSNLAYTYYFDRQYDLALATVKVALASDPGLDFSNVLGWIHRERGAYEEAIAELRKSGDRAPNAFFFLGQLGNAYARAGRVREARRCLKELKDRIGEGNVGAYEASLLHAGLGEKDQACEWLQKAYDAHDLRLVYLRVDPPLDPLRSDPRFQALLRRMNFPP
jgi:TolB-like protein/Flp pilus assembly protein TadD